jgi:hypothetical protein
MGLLELLELMGLQHTSLFAFLLANFSLILILVLSRVTFSACSPSLSHCSAVCIYTRWAKFRNFPSSAGISLLYVCERGQRRPSISGLLGTEQMERRMLR